MRREDLHPEVVARLRRYTTEYLGDYGVVPAAPDTGPITLGSHGGDVDAAMLSLGRIEAAPAQGLRTFLRSRIPIRQEALASSGMEGTHSTLGAVLGLDNDADADVPTRQVRDYALALEELVPRAKALGPTIFTPGFFCRVHQIVTANMPECEEVSGSLRSRVVWIGGYGSDIAYSTWNPPGPEHVASCLQETADYMRGNGPHATWQPLLLRIALAHAHFEAVHPFSDGNGRVGRILISLMLAAEGREPVYMSRWIEANRSLYYEGLKRAQQQLDPALLTGVLARAIVETEAELIASDAAIAELGQKWRATFRFRRGSSAERLLDVVQWLPVLSVKAAIKLLGVTPKAANDGIAVLCSTGILREVTGKRRNRIFEAPDVMCIVNRPFGSTPVLPNSLAP